MAFSAEGGLRGRVVAFERHITKWLQRAQEVHQLGLIPPVRTGRAGGGGLTFRQGFGFGFEIDLGIDIRGLLRHMPQPSADRVDVNARAQKVSRRGMTDGMGTDALCRQRWRSGSGLLSVAFDYGMDPRTSNMMSDLPMDEDPTRPSEKWGSLPLRGTTCRIRKTGETGCSGQS